MKGFILKDLLGLRRYMRTLTVALVLYIFFTFIMNSSSFLNGMVALLVFMLPLTVFAYDESAKWDVYGLTLPVSKQEIVLSRYLLTLIFAAGGWIFSSVISLLFHLFKGNMEQMGEDLMANTLVCGLSLIAAGIMLPIIYRLGAEKGRFAMIGVILVISIGGYLLYKMDMNVNLDRLFQVFFKLLPVLVIAVLAISFGVSCWIYRRKEF